jgi:hypothetical protein
MSWNRFANAYFRSAAPRAFAGERRATEDRRLHLLAGWVMLCQRNALVAGLAYILLIVRMCSHTFSFILIFLNIETCLKLCTLVLKLDSSALKKSQKVVRM